MDIRVKKPEEMESEELVPLTPGLIRQYKDNINLAFAPYRWRRFVLRLVDRVIWHWHGLLLWLVQRPSLRYLPYPYPAVATVKDWLLQAEAMTHGSALSSRHLLRG